MAASILEQKVELYIEKQPDWFENLVLGCIIQDLEFYLRVRNILCKGVDAKSKVKDFSALLRNAVYDVVSAYNTAMALHPERGFVPINAEVMAVMLRNSTSGDDTLMVDEIPQAMELFNQAATIDLARWKPIVDIGMLPWITQQKMTQVVQQSYLFGGWTLQDIRERLDGVAQQVKSVDVMKGTQRGVLGQFLDNPAPEIVGDVLPSNIRRLNDVLGGGFGKGDTVLVISPSGGGKTILACQLAGHWANLGYGGIFVTTEQPQEQLERRFLSNFAGIPFKDVVRNWDPAALSEKHKHGYKTWRDGIKAPVQFVDWTVPGKSIMADLRTEVLHYKSVFGELPHYLIFDWVGGALQGSAEGDSQKLRALYKSAVDTVDYIAKEFNLSGVALAQVTPGKGAHRFPITIENIADAKNMAEKVTSVVGLTALFAEGMDQETDHTRVMYAEKQFFCVSKSRKGTGGNAPVRRRFDYQRLEDYS
jgi:hypothetical protein